MKFEELTDVEWVALFEAIGLERKAVFCKPESLKTFNVHTSVETNKHDAITTRGEK